MIKLYFRLLVISLPDKGAYLCWRVRENFIDVKKCKFLLSIIL